SRTSASNWQYSHTSGQARLAPIRSSRPVILAPRSLIAGAAPGFRSLAPSKSARSTRARMIRSGPQASDRTGSSANRLPARRSTQSPVANASHTSRSVWVRSSGATCPILSDYRLLQRTSDQFELVHALLHAALHAGVDVRVPVFPGLVLHEQRQRRPPVLLGEREGVDRLRVR